MKKIYRKLQKGENPIFTDITHGHLATCDFASGMIYHYLDAENDGVRRLLDAHKIKKSEMDEDIEMIAKNQFEKNFKITELESDDDRFALALDIIRGTHPKIDRYQWLVKLSEASKKISVIMETFDVGHGHTMNFGDIHWVLGFSSKKINDAIKWWWKGVESENKHCIKALDSITLNIQKNNAPLDSVGYLIDSECYMHPTEVGEIDLNPYNSIKLSGDIIKSMEFEMEPADVKLMYEWIKKHNCS